MPSKENVVPSLGTEAILGTMRARYLQEGGKETPEQLRARMLAALNEELTPEELEEALPEKYRPYLIRDPKVQQKRAEDSRKVREILVAFHTGDIDKKQTEPYPINRSGSTIRAYLKKTGQEELIEEYSRVMDASPERQEELAKDPVFADNNVSMAAYDRGHMLARLCEPFKNLTVMDILNMTPDEKLAHMEELLFLYSIAMNTEQVLHQKEKDRVHSLIKFNNPDRELCNHVLDLMDATGMVASMANIMSNPCYQYLDVEKLFREQDLIAFAEDGALLTANNGGAVSRLGQNLFDGATKVQREYSLRIEEQLKTLGMNLNEAGWSEQDGTKLLPDGHEGIEYIAEGKPVIVTDGKQKFTVTGGRGREVQIKPYVPLDDRIPRLYRELKEIGIDPKQAMFATEDGKVFDPDREKDAADYAAGKAILVSQGDVQIIIRDVDKNGDPKWNYTGVHYEREYPRVQAENRAAEADTQQADEESRRVIADEEQMMAEAAEAAEEARHQPLAEVRNMIRKAGSIFVKGSPEFRSIRDSLREYAHMEAMDAEDPDSVEEAKALLEQIRQTAQAYLGNKEGDGTTRLERKRVRAVRQVQAYVQQQLNRLGVIEEHRSAAMREERSITARRENLEKRKEQERSLKYKVNNPGKNVGLHMPENVRKYYEEKHRRAVDKKTFSQAAAKFAQAEYPESTPNTLAIDGELLGALERYESVTDQENWKTSEKLNGEPKKAASELLTALVLKSVIRNDQYAHPDNPSAGVINQLAGMLELGELKKVIGSTPTVQEMLQNVTGQSVTGFVLEQSSPNQKEKLLKIMKEIPGSARTMLQGMPENSRKQVLLAKLGKPEVQKAAAPK